MGREPVPPHGVSTVGTVEHNRGVKVPRVERTATLVGLVFALLCLVGGAGAAAAVESDTVPSFWGGLWWSLCLMTNLGFVYGRPHSSTGAVVSVVLMVSGFLLLSLLSATLAAMFIRAEAEPAERLSTDLEREILGRLDEISRRVESLEQRLPERD